MQRLEGDFGVMGGAVKAEDVSISNGRKGNTWHSRGSTQT
jgi:hypothetical protein